MSTNESSKPRVMTVKGFLHKANGKAANSAGAFISAHRAWLETGELSEVTSPILRLMDSGDMFPTPALEEIKLAVLTHSIRVNAEKAERELMASLDKENSPSGNRTTKNWVATVYNAKGKIVMQENAKGELVELQQNFLLASDADRWIDRRLFEGEPDNFGVVSHTKLTGKDGTALSTTIMRQDAIARILKRPSQGAAKKVGVRDGKLSFGVKAHQSHCHFSHG